MDRLISSGPIVLWVGTSTSLRLPMSSGVPQGSVLGPMLYTAYVAPVGRLIASYGVHFHTLYMLMTHSCPPDWKHLSQSPSVGCRTVSVDFNIGFGTTDFYLIPARTARRLKQSCLPPVTQFAGSDIKVSASLQLLGVTLDSTLSFDQHINNIIKNCNYHLQALRHLRSSVTTEVANMLACSIFGSRIDSVCCHVWQEPQQVAAYTKPSS